MTPSKVAVTRSKKSNSQTDKSTVDSFVSEAHVELSQTQKNLENFARRKYLEAGKTAAAFVDQLNVFSRTEGNMLKGYELTMLAAVRAAKVPLNYN